MSVSKFLFLFLVPFFWLSVAASQTAMAYEDLSMRILIGTSHASKASMHGLSKRQKGKKICPPASYPCALPGFGGLISPGRSFRRIGNKYSTNSSNWINQCDEARLHKTAYHVEFNDGDVPDSFGKIVHWHMNAGAIIGPPLPDKIEGWMGIAHICSWIGDDEYYFELSISGNLWQKGMGANPFPHTLNPSALEPTTRDEFLEEMKQWDWKFHASEMGVVMTKVVKNNQVILEPGGTSTDPVLTDAHMDNCFDVFFAGAPPTAGTNNLPDQQNYCMGRCDALMLNTR